MKNNIAKNSAITVLGIFLLTACLINPDSTDNSSEINDSLVFSIDSIRVVSNNNRVIELTCFTTTNDPCYSLAYSKITQSDNTIRITPVVQRDPALICPMVLGSLDFDVSFAVPENGFYDLKFVDQQSELDTTIFVGD
ncbi:MAG: hypothetical protein R3C41_05855 [Calditrichia bacterium]